MKIINILLFISILLCASCQDDNDNSPMVIEEPPIELEPKRCVDVEEIASEAIGFLVFDQGLQEEGRASGIKINQEWNASAELIADSTKFRIVNRTFWHGIIDGNDYGESYALAELLRLVKIPFDISMGCYSLSDNETNIAQDSIECTYSLHHNDITVARYQLDHTAENNIELVDFDEANNVFVARLEASFFTDENPGLPHYPDSLRFFNVEMEIGVE